MYGFCLRIGHKFGHMNSYHSTGLRVPRELPFVRMWRAVGAFSGGLPSITFPLFSLAPYASFPPPGLLTKRVEKA